MLLVCVLDKIGTFGMLRFCLGLLPDGLQWATPVVITLALISIVYGALVAIGQDDMLRLFGFMSLSHFGFIVLGIFVFTSQGGSGAVLYMVNHGIATAALFLVAGFLIKRRGTASIRAMGGVEKVAPVLAGLFLVFGLAALSLPGLSPFVSEILVLIAAFQHHWWIGAIAVTAIVLTAFYVLWMYQRTMTGPDPVPGRRAGPPADLDRREVGTLAPLLLGAGPVRLLPDAAAQRDQPLRRRPAPARRRSDHAPVAPAAAPRPREDSSDRARHGRHFVKPHHRVRLALADPHRLRCGLRSASSSRRSCPRQWRYLAQFGPDRRRRSWSHSSASASSRTDLP